MKCIFKIHFYLNYVILRSISNKVRLHFVFQCIILVNELIELNQHLLSEKYYNKHYISCLKNLTFELAKHLTVESMLLCRVYDSDSSLATTALKDA